MRNIFSSNITTKEAKAEQLFAVLNFAVPLLMGIYLFFTPFPHTTSIKEFSFYISLLALIVLLIFKKTHFSLRSPLTIPFFLFFLWGIFGLCFTLDLTNSIHDLRAHFLKYVAIYFLLVNYFNSYKKLDILSWIVIVSATIFSLGAIVVYYFIDGNAFLIRLGETFLEVHTDYIGFVLIFPFALTLIKLANNKSSIIIKSILLICAIITCLATLLTQSKGSLIAILITIIILSFFNKKILVFLIITILLVMTIPNFKDRITVKEILENDRVKINALTMEIIKTYPITGLGFGMQIYGNEKLVDFKKFDSRLPAKHQRGVGVPFMGSPHNTILDVAVRTGIVGLIIFLSILLTALWMLWQSWKSAKSEYFKSWIVCALAAFLSFMTAALFADTTFGPPAVVFYTILAVITILWKMKDQNQPDGGLAEMKKESVIN